MPAKKTLKARLDVAEYDLAHLRVKIAELEVRLAKLEQPAPYAASWMSHEQALSQYNAAQNAVGLQQHQQMQNVFGQLTGGLFR